MSKLYEEPSWGCEPKFKFWIEVLKDGKIIDEIKFQLKSYYFVGKQPDICDVVLDHPSISRQHAVFQFRDDGALLLFDFNSGNGTFINKTEMSKSTYQRLHIGDFIKFGASTRQYIVCGEEDSQKLPEYDSKNMENYRKQLELKSEKALLKKSAINAEKKALDTEVSWGFGEDAVNDPESDEDVENNEELPNYLKNLPGSYAKHESKAYVSNIHKSISREKEAQLTDKQRDIYEKIKVKEKKVCNMQEEVRRIYMKENSQEDGLTSGQLQTATRNESRIKEVIEEIYVLEKQLDKSLHGGNSTNGIKGVSKSSKFNDDDDGMLDTTKVNNTNSEIKNWRTQRKLARSGQIGQSNSNSMKQTNEGAAIMAKYGVNGSNAINYNEISVILDMIQTNYEEVVSKINQLEDSVTPNNNSNGLAASVAGSSNSNAAPNDAIEDDIDKIIRQANLQDNAASLVRLRKKESELRFDLEYFQKLQKIATPALKSLISQDSGNYDREVDKHDVDTSSSSVIQRVTSLNNYDDGKKDLNAARVRKHSSASKMSLSSCVAGLQELKRRREDSDSVEEQVESDSIHQNSLQMQNPEVKRKKMVGPSRPSVADTLMQSNNSGW